MKAVILAAIDTIKVKIIKRTFYKKFFAFMVAAFAVKLDDNTDLANLAWEDNTPSIFDINEIVNELNNPQNHKIMNLDMLVCVWTKDDIRPYFELLYKYHNDMSNVRHKQLSCIETVASLQEFVSMSWKDMFKSMLDMHRNLDS